MDRAIAQNILVIQHYPSSTIGETPFTLIYWTDIMLLVDIDMPTWRRSHFNKEENQEGLKYNTNLVDETRDIAYVREFSSKHIAARSYNSKVIQRLMQEGDLVIRQVIMSAQ